MVGSGFFLAPSAMAPYGVLAIVAWVVMGGGAICLALTFARLARIAPATGGPYAYTRLAFGNLAGFLVAWGYWISLWASLPAIALTFAGSLVTVLPAFQASRTTSIVIALGAIWLVVLTNLRGVKQAGVFAEVTTYSKLLPFAAITVAGLAFVQPANLSAFNPSGQGLLASSAALAPLTMFAFLGLESATVPAGDVVSPERTIPRSTMLGVSIATLLYVLGTTVVMGVVPRDQLVLSAAPFADAARIMGGAWAAGAVGLAVMLSLLGTLNGLTLLMGQVPMAAAGDTLFPSFFGKVSSRGVPALGTVVSAALATILTLTQFTGAERLASFYSLVINLATLTTVVPYAFCALAVGVISTQPARDKRWRGLTAVEWIAFAFSIFTIYGCGAEAVLYGFVLLMLGIPVYVWQRRQRL